MQTRNSEDDFLSIQEIANEIRERVRAKFRDPAAPGLPEGQRAAIDPRPTAAEPLRRGAVSPPSLVFTQELVNLTRGGQLLVGRMPPQPPTLRARFGAFFVQLVRRMLFWYTPQVQEFQRAVANATAEQRDAIQDLRLVTSSSREQLRTEQQERESLTARLEERIRAEMDSRERLGGRLAEQLRGEIAAREYLSHRFEQQIDVEMAARESLASQLNEQLRMEALARKTLIDGYGEQARTEAEAREAVAVRLAEQLRAEIAARESLAARLNEQLNAEAGAREALAFKVDSLIEELNRLVSRMNSGGMEDAKGSKTGALIEDVRREVAIQERRISMITEEVRRKRGSANTDGASPQPQVDHLNVPPAFYLDFEDAFRGTRKDIRDRLKVYLPRLQEAGIVGPTMPALDLGCGRGEWIEVLTENSTHVSGVDSNSAMVDECRKRGFTVFEADAIEFLRRLPAESQGCVTAFHVVEHLPFERIVTLIDEIVRVLKPGGLAILETPNPENLVVGACTFYYDPTHVRPLPKELMRFLIEARGLCSVETLPLHPNLQAGHFADQVSPVAELLKQYLYGPQDYAVIGRKV